MIGVYVTSAKGYELYDSNTGHTTVFPRAGFRPMMEQLPCDSFVVA